MVLSGADELARLLDALRAELEELAAAGWRDLPVEARSSRPAPGGAGASPAGSAPRPPRLRPPRSPSPRAPSPPPAAPSQPPLAFPPGADLDAIRSIVGACTRCPLHRGRHHLVFGVGDPDADLVVCGEGPGREEDLRGEPFVGRAGQMLDRMLVNVLGLRREQVYILNVVKCRPPGNRTPQPEEIASCRPILEAQIRAVRPRVILALGRPAAQTLSGSSRGIRRMRGQWFRYEGIPVMPTYHPAFLLRTPACRRETFEDLKELRRRYDALGGRR